MKTTLFARPNLRLFLVCALGLLALQHLITARGATSILVVGRSDSGEARQTIQRLVVRSLEQPTAENYLVLSECYRQLGETAQALRYVRKARLAAEIEGD